MPIPPDHSDANTQKNVLPASNDENTEHDSDRYQDNVEAIEKNDIAGDDIDIETEGANPLKAKIILSSPSIDIAIATLETSDFNTANTETIDKNNHVNNDNRDKANEAELEAERLEDHQVETNSLTESLPVEDLSDDEMTEKKQEVIEQKKEAKLESYKQFVAEQFSHQKVDYPEVRVSIEANALPSGMYFMMNTLSAIIASYGLITNSAAVVIGAMLVAMMLGPITGVALAIIDYRMPLLRKSLFTVAAGALLVIVVGFLVGWLHQDQPLTAEILSRTQPTSMDLMIALAGGTAGAYAMVSPHLSVAVVGVAVATALVPPLASSGILFAHGEMALGLGAALLALTNIIAIQFTNAMVLWFLGFRRLVDDDYQSNTYWTFLKRNAVPLLLLIGLGIYLTINLNNSAQQQSFENRVKASINRQFEDKGNVLTNTQFNEVNGKQIIRAVIRGESTPTSYDVQQIEESINQEIKKDDPNHLPIKLQLRYMPIQVIESDPLIQEQLNKKDVAMLSN